MTTKAEKWVVECDTAKFKISDQGDDSQVATIMTCGKLLLFSRALDKDQALAFADWIHDWFEDQK